MTVTQMDPRMRVRRLRAAYLAMPRHLSARPEPRHVFDNVARQDNPLPPKGADLAEICRNVMRSAVASGDVDTMEATEGEIIGYFLELLAYALSDSPRASVKTIDGATLTAIDEVADAMAAISRAGVLRSAGSIEDAVREAGEAVVSLEVFRETATGLPRGTIGKTTRVTR